jgi:hypothetical protein
MFLGFYFNLRDTSNLRKDIAALPTHATLALQNAEMKRQFEHMADLIQDVLDVVKQEAKSEPMTQAQARFEKVTEDTCTVPGDEGEVFAERVGRVTEDASIEWCEYGSFEEAYNRGAGEPPAHFRPPPNRARPSPPVPKSELRRRVTRPATFCRHDVQT